MAATVAQRMNVLLVLVDDLRPQLGAYNHSDQMYTPNIDALAKDALVFEHGYTNYPYCSPSRNSFMSGRLPDTNQIWTFANSFRNEAGWNWTSFYQPKRSVWTSLPGHFKKHGFWAAGAGKLYHPNSPINEDNPLSWSINYPIDVGGGCSCEPDGVLFPEGGCPSAAQCNYCMLPSNTTCYDVNITETVIAQLNSFKEKPPNPNFFIGLGIHKPHLPWAAPKEFFDLYPPAEELAIAAHPEVSPSMPPIAWHQCTWNAFPYWFTKGAPVNRTVAQHARRAYYAATSFADHLVGRVLDRLDVLGLSDSTIVMLVGDHGWQLGEHNEWGKQTVFEVATRIPFIIRDPRHTLGGRRTTGFAELIDVYKTLAELSGAPPPEAGVQGTSLAALVRGDASAAKDAAFTQMARCFSGHIDAATGACGRGGTGRACTYSPFASPDACTSSLPTEIEFMGYSIRTESWRYTEWVAFDGTSLRPIWTQLNATELYAHSIETVNSFDTENLNLATNESYASVMVALSKRLRSHAEANMPPAPLAQATKTDDEAPTFSAPVFSAATGSYFVNVSAPAFQSDTCRDSSHAGPSTQLEILLPLSTSEATTLVLALPVGDCGTSTEEYGSAIALIRKNKWLDAHPEFAVATMAFSTTPWFADKPANGSAEPVLQESYILKVVLPYLLNTLAVNGTRPIASTANVSLVGFSKSGWGSFSLLARNPRVFDKAAIWDSPTMLSTAYCEWLCDHQCCDHQWNMMQVFGDCETWSTHSPIEIVGRGGAAALDNRLWLAGQHYFGNMSGQSRRQGPGWPFSHTVDFHAALMKQLVAHEYNDRLDPGKHEWLWLWLEPALDFLAMKR